MPIIVDGSEEALNRIDNELHNVWDRDFFFFLGLAGVDLITNQKHDGVQVEIKKKKKVFVQNIMELTVALAVYHILR